LSSPKGICFLAVAVAPALAQEQRQRQPQPQQQILCEDGKQEKQ